MRVCTVNESWKCLSNNIYLKRLYPKYPSITLVAFTYYFEEFVSPLHTYFTSLNPTCIVLLICRYCLRWYPFSYPPTLKISYLIAKIRGSRVLFSLLSSFGFILYQGNKEWGGRQSEKEGSNLREVEWFSGVRNQPFQQDSHQKLCVLEYTHSRLKQYQEELFMSFSVSVYKKTHN